MDTKHAGMSGTGHSDVEYNGARQCRCDMAAGGRCSYHHKKYRRQGLFLLLGLAASVLVGNVLLKNIVARPRPCRIDASVPLLIANPTDYSFPSGHTLSSVISAVILAKTDRRFGYAAIPLAVLIAFSRLYLYVHFPSNVLASAVLGIIIGHLIFRFGDSLLNKLKAPRLRAKS